MIASSGQPFSQYPCNVDKGPWSLQKTSFDALEACLFWQDELKKINRILCLLDVKSMGRKMP
jgi:hypothetical protein